ncbi:rhomboid family intramembrane serine protease [Halorussus caseinilyticus]|uniref:Rhomboid family intramembrane serine protease n=1 Tax=Halorussus caseinilyticus TaxID=3034025 RepID=A0ABD5WPU1_9EURY|nr:rhomboid family intramembrane serine protease [Halorussus sp. DT72]
MAQCDECGEHENMPYNCRRCGGTYCSTHRLPESHDCPGLNEWNDPDGVFDSGFDDSVNEGGQSSGVSDRIGVNTGPGGPLGYFRDNMTYVFLGLMWLTFAAQLVVQLTAPWLVGPIFVLQSDHLLRVWTWVTSIFAHGGFGHIALNSIVLYFFGPVVERRIGSKKFVALFLVAGMAAGLAQAGVSAIMYPGIPSGVVGASGAIAAILGVLTVLNPSLTIYLYFILPMPLWLATTLFVGYSVFVSATGGIGAGGVAQLAHLAGVAIGLAYGAKLKQEGERAPQELQLGGGGGPGRGPGGPGGPGGRF